MESIAIRQQLTKGYSVVLHDKKPGLVSADDEVGFADVVAACVYFPNFSKGSFIGYIAVSDGNFVIKSKKNDIRYQKTQLSQIFFYISHKHATDVFKTLGYIYLKTHGENVPLRKFKRNNFKKIMVSHRNDLVRDAHTFEKDHDYNPMICDENFPENDQLIPLFLHPDHYKKNVWLVRLPEETSETDIIPVPMEANAPLLSCCANKECYYKKDESQEPPTLSVNYQCLNCYQFCHRQCFQVLSRTYDSPKSYMHNPSSTYFSGMKWLNNNMITNGYCNDDVDLNKVVQRVVCNSCSRPNKVSKSSKCVLSDDHNKSLIQCYNQQDRIPHEKKCGACNKPVHFGCSIIYANSLEVGDVPNMIGHTETEHFVVRCLNCCYNESKVFSGKQCAYGRHCEYKHISIPFFQRCYC